MFPGSFLGGGLEDRVDDSLFSDLQSSSNLSFSSLGGLSSFAAPAKRQTSRLGAAASDSSTQMFSDLLNDDSYHFDFGLDDDGSSHNKDNHMSFQDNLSFFSSTPSAPSPKQQGFGVSALNSLQPTGTILPFHFHLHLN